MITYKVEPDLAVDEFVAILERSTLAERRPVGDRERMRKMLSGADVIVTARADGLIVGVSRSITDGAYSRFELPRGSACDSMGEPEGKIHHISGT